MLSGINLYLYAVGFFPIKFIALQIASYTIAAFLLIRDYTKRSKQNLNMEALITGGLYAVFFIFNIVSTKIETGPGTEVIRHIQWSRMFVIFAFIVVVLSKLRFKKYNSIISALCVFFGGFALNIGIVYNQDLANYATWLPQILHKHLIISVCYGVGHFIINMLLQRRENPEDKINIPHKVTDEEIVSIKENL
jgi:positive regulator of sigma E activity